MADLLEAFAFPPPITVICELIGNPDDDRILFRDRRVTICCRHWSRSGTPTTRCPRAELMAMIFLLLVAGREVPAREWVVLVTSPANRDPSRYGAADRLDVGRDSSGHVAFGHGITGSIPASSTAWRNSPSASGTGLTGNSFHQAFGEICIFDA